MRRARKLFWVYQNRELKPHRIEIEEAEEAQNRITVHFKGGKMTF